MALIVVHVVSSSISDPIGTSPVATTTFSPPEHEERKSFSNVAKLGFASGYDAPDLMSRGPTADSSSGSSPVSSSPWSAEAGNIIRSSYPITDAN